MLALQPNLFLLLAQRFLQPFLLCAFLSLQLPGSAFSLPLLLFSSLLQVTLSAGFIFLPLKLLSLSFLLRKPRLKFPLPLFLFDQFLLLAQDFLLLLDHAHFIDPLLFLPLALLLQSDFFGLAFDPLSLQALDAFLLGNHSQTFSFDGLGL